MSDPRLGPSDAQITIMRHNITARIATVRGRRRRTARLAVAGAGLLVGVSLTAAVFAVASAPQEVREGTFTCYSADDIHSEFYAITLDDREAGSPRALALEACEIAYGLRGVIAPQPTVCELPDLRLAIFPNFERVDSADLCASLGLASLD